MGRERQDSGMISKDFDLDDCEHGRRSRFGMEYKFAAKDPGFEGAAESLLVGLAGSADIPSPTGSFAAAAFKLISVHLRRAPG